LSRTIPTLRQGSFYSSNDLHRQRKRLAIVTRRWGIYVSGVWEGPRRARYYAMGAPGHTTYYTNAASCIPYIIPLTAQATGNDSTALGSDGKCGVWEGARRAGCDADGV